MTMPVLVALVALAQAPAAAPESIAVPAWSVVEVKPELAAFFADHVAGTLRGRGFRVVTSAEMQSLLSMERQKELLGCADTSSSCMAELANALGCAALLVGNVARLEETYRANLKLLRASDGQVLAETRVTAKGQNALLEELEGAATRLADAVKPKAKGGDAPVGEVKATGGGLKKWWWAPGAAGVVVTAVGIGSLVQAQKTYDTLAGKLTSPAAADLQENKDLAAAGETQQTLGWVAVGVGAAALAGAGAMYLFGGDAPPPVTPTVSVSPGGASVGVAGVWP